MMMSGREDEGRVVTLGGEISALGGISADISGSSAGRPRSGAGSTAGGGLPFSLGLFHPLLQHLSMSGKAVLQLCNALHICSHLFTSETKI